jgi:integrase
MSEHRRRSTRRFVYGHTRQEAARKLTELLRQAQQGLPVPVAKLTVGNHLEAWLTEVAAHKVRPSTFRGYAMNVRTHLVPGLGRRKLARLSAADVRWFLHAKREAGLSQATVRQLHGILRSALSPGGMTAVL